MLLDAACSVLRFMVVQPGQQVRQLLVRFKSRRVGAAVSPGMGSSRGYSSPEWLAGMPARVFCAEALLLRVKPQQLPAACSASVSPIRRSFAGSRPALCWRRFPSLGAALFAGWRAGGVFLGEVTHAASLGGAGLFAKAGRGARVLGRLSV